MSTKIYNAYKYSFYKNNKIHSIIKSIQEEVIPVVEKELFSLFFKGLFKIIDNYYLDKDRYNIETFNEKYNYLYSDTDHIKEFKNLVSFKNNQPIIYEFKKYFLFLSHFFEKEIRQRTTDLDFTFSFFLYQSDKYKNTYFVIPNFEKSNLFLPFIDKKTKLKDFSYWNNTDKPNSIKNREWKNRKKTWYSIDFENYEKIEIIDSKFIYQTYIKFLDILENGYIEKYLPESLSLENRLKKYIIKQIQNKELQEMSYHNIYKNKEKLFKELNIKEENLKQNVSDYILKNNIKDFINPKDGTVYYNIKSYEQAEQIFIEHEIWQKKGSSFFTKNYMEWRDFYNKNKDLYDKKALVQIKNYLSFFPENITLKNYLLTNLSFD